MSEWVLTLDLALCASAGHIERDSRTTRLFFSAWEWWWERMTMWNGDGACAHYVMVSKFQWKPLWLATQRDPQNDWTATQNRVNYDVFAQAPLIAQEKGKRENGGGGGGGGGAVRITSWYQKLMEAILACHPALFAEWLVTVVCKLWHIRTGSITAFFQCVMTCA